MDVRIFFRDLDGRAHDRGRSFKDLNESAHGRDPPSPDRRGRADDVCRLRESVFDFVGNRVPSSPQRLRLSRRRAPPCQGRVGRWRGGRVSSLRRSPSCRRPARIRRWSQPSRRGRGERRSRSLPPRGEREHTRPSRLPFRGRRERNRPRRLMEGVESATSAARQKFGPCLASRILGAT